MKSKLTFAFWVLLLLIPLLASSSKTTPPSLDERMAWWREARYGMFIHWSAASQIEGMWKGRPAGEGLFSVRNAKIPLAEYEKALAPFNPVKFDAEKWVLLAKESGMRYIVFTAKHHDGFAMWHSRASAFNIVDHTVFGRDILAELAAACKKHDVKLGLYYSQARDWYHPGGAIGLGKMKAWDKAQEGKFEDYIHKVALPQVRELLTGYGPISILWWDTPDQMTPEIAREFEELLVLQPSIITNSRLLDRNNTGGDLSTPERNIPAKRPHDRDMEVCTTMNKSWGFTAHDHRWKSSLTLLHYLIECASKGGNFLLNIGPDASGEIPRESITRLQEIGAWMHKYGQSIYGTREGPFRYWEYGRATRRGNTLYLHVFKWPADGQLLVPLANASGKAQPLANSDKTIPLNASPRGLLLDVSSLTPDSLVSVITLDLDEAPKAIRQGHNPDADGNYSLAASDGERHGLSLRLTGDTVSSWGGCNYFLSWPVYVDKAGSYRVQANYASAPGTAGGNCEVKFDEQTITASARPTKSSSDFQDIDLGKIELPADSTVEVSFRIDRAKDRGNLRLKSISLIPAE